jgi:hypothetical protein
MFLSAKNTCLSQQDAEIQEKKRRRNQRFDTFVAIEMRGTRMSFGREVVHWT